MSEASFRRQQLVSCSRTRRLEQDTGWWLLLCADLLRRAAALLSLRERLDQLHRGLAAHVLDAAALAEAAEEDVHRVDEGHLGRIGDADLLAVDANVVAVVGRAEQRAHERLLTGAVAVAVDDVL